MAVGLAASAAFMTPFSHKANLLVMGAGGFRSMDYVKVGTPLTLVVLVWLASLVGMVVVVLGFLMVLFTGRVNPELRDVGQSLARYIYENIRYLTYNTDDRPFPFGNPWPSVGTDED